MKRHWKAAELLTAATGFSTRRFYATFAPPLTHWKVAGSREATAREQLKFQERSRRALRCTLLRTLLPD